MALSFKNISYAYGDTPVLHNLSFEAKPGEITCLLGPSGGGKSTLLRLAAGIETVQAGRVEVDGELIASESFFLPPEKRPVGLMFQENALFPHMTIAQNVGFGLNQLSAADSSKRIAELLAMVGLSDFGTRYPHALSGGQQQRVALVRSLAPQPRVLLMDEPYASIDITLRRSLREAARHTLKHTETTSVMVTHDPPEAMEMADTIAVLDAGKIVQVGSPQTLYEQPAAATVAALFGDAQRIDAQRDGTTLKTLYGDIALNPSITQRLNFTDCELVVRPKGLSVKRSADSPLRIVDLRYVGEAWIAFILPENAPPAEQALRLQVNQNMNIGERVSLQAADSGCFVYAKQARP